MAFAGFRTTALAVVSISLSGPLCLADETASQGGVRLEQAALPSTGLHEIHVLRFAIAEKIAQAFFSCAERKDTARSIHIVDQFGNTVYAGRMDGQFSDNIDAARLKAQSALYFRAETTPWMKRGKDDLAYALQVSQLGQFTSPVGLPIIVENQLLGAVGIGGASGDCAREALSRVLGPDRASGEPARR